MQSYDIEPAKAVRVIDQALGILGLGKPPEQPVEEVDVSTVTDLVKEKTGAGRPFPEPDVGGTASSYPAAMVKKGDPPAGEIDGH